MKTKTLALVAVLLVAPATGCIGFGAEDIPGTEDDNEPPKAELNVTPKKAWNGDSITLNARGSSDSDGSVETWILDLGDGTQKKAEKREQAEFKHSYDQGGVYDVSLTVIDDGGNKTGPESDTTTQEVVINEQIRIPAQSTFAGPGSSSNSSTYRQEFPVQDHGDRFELNMTLQSQTPAGSSQAKISVLDPSDDTITTETVTLNASEQRSVELRDELNDTGRHTVKIETQSGSISFEGELRVFYEAPNDSEVDT